MSVAGEKRTLEETDVGAAVKEEATEQPAPNSEPTQGEEKTEEPAAKRTRADEEEKPTTGAATQSNSQPPPAPQPPLYQSDPSGWPEGMRPSVRERLEALFASGKCRRDEIDLKIMQSLSEFSEASALQILINFGEADMGSIRNKSAFLAGVMKRFRTENPLGNALTSAPSMGAYGPGLGLSSSFSGDAAGMIPGVQARLESIFASGKVRIPCFLPASAETYFYFTKYCIQVRREELDQRCLEQLRSLPEHVGLEVFLSPNFVS
jgi:hypothetical protein